MPFIETDDAFVYDPEGGLKLPPGSPVWISRTHHRWHVRIFFIWFRVPYCVYKLVNNIIWIEQKWENW